MKTSSQGSRTWPGSHKQWEAPSGICASKLGGVDLRGASGVREESCPCKGIAEVLEEAVGVTNFIINTNLCQHQLMPRKHVEGAGEHGCQGGAQSEFGPQPGLRSRGQLSTLVVGACWRGAK